MESTIDPDFNIKCLNIVKNELLELTKENNCQIFLFGSRARFQGRRSSDIDVGIKNLDSDTFRKVKISLENFWEESIVPYKIDLVNFDKVSSEFYTEAIKDTILWKTD